MNQRVFVALLITLMLPLVVAPLLSIHDGVVMHTDNDGQHGRLCIPSAGIDTGLTLAHEGCTCCYLGLWNGGSVIADDAQMFASVKVGDWVDIRQPECRLVLECVEVVSCIAIGSKLIGPRGIINPDGDVLLCVGLGWWRVRVYRMVRL